MSDYGIRSIDSQHSFASSATPSRDPSPSPSSRTSSRARSLRDSLESLDVATQETTPTASTTSAASASRSIHAQDHSTSPIATPAASSTATTSQGNDGESPFQAYERYKVDAPHPLASFLSSSEVEHAFPSPTFLASPPMAPMSSSSVEGSPELRGQHWEDSRSCSHGGSTSGEGSGAEGGHHQLVMPSMRLPPPESHSEDQQMRSKGGRPHSRLLLAGRTRDERDELARLLGGREGGSRRDTELSYSFLSTRLSDKSRNSSHQTLSTDWDELIEEMHFRADSTTFYQPRSSSAGGVSSSGAMELAAMLQAGLEGKERFIDGTYPSTQSLADFVGKGLDGELEGALMLFSSPPIPCEVAYARIISQVLPIYPVLVLPPSPTSKPQKTSALVNAVIEQLDAAGVRWTPAPDRAGDGKSSPFFIIPQEILAGTDDYGPYSSGTSSLASSQILAPRAGPGSSHSNQSTHGDLPRLHILVNSQDAMRRNRAIAFLHWREIEVAARGGRVLDVSVLPAEWNEKGLDGVEVKSRSQLDFSRRVAERRFVLAATGRQNLLTFEDQLSNENAAEDNQQTTSIDEDYDDSNTAATFSESLLHQSSFTDPATPRPTYRSMSSSTPSSVSSAGQHSAQASRSSSYHFSVPPTPPPIYCHATQDCPSVHGSDPFYLPSIFHLVGLNLRMSLLLPSDKPHRGIRAWIGTAALVGFVFITGMICGGQQAGALGVLWKEVWKGGARQVTRW